VNDAFVLVDLPGYGFAVGPEAERRAWGPLVETYLAGRPTLGGVLLVIDIRRGVEPEEDELLGYLAALARPAAVVATKLDKLARNAARTSVARLRDRLPPDVPAFGFSARTGEGRPELWRVLSAWSDAVRERASP